LHLLNAPRESVSDGGEAVDLGQTPGDICVLTAADTEIACLAAANRTVQRGMTLRLANLMRLSHPMSVDQWIVRTGRHARVIVVRVLGGEGYWPHGLAALQEMAAASGTRLAVLPGDDRPDPALARFSTVDAATCDWLLACLAEGGEANAGLFLDGCAALAAGRAVPDVQAAPLPKAGLWQADAAALATEKRPRAAVLFYRALVQSGQTTAMAALCDALEAKGLAPMPVHVSSLRDPFSAALLQQVFQSSPPAVILNATAFAVNAPGAEPARTAIDAADCPVLQVALAGATRDAWQASARGLGAKDLIMNIALPEVDGRIFTRAISFKAAAFVDDTVECAIATHQPDIERCAFVAELAAAWARLRMLEAPAKRVALIFANYPNRDGRLANGVGLDTPQGAAEILKALNATGLDVGEAPTDGATLMDVIRAGVTNAAAALPGGVAARQRGERLSLKDYKALLADMPELIQAEIAERWGAPESDPFVSGGAFLLPFMRFGNIVIGVQPARGYNIDPSATYHSPDLVPPHNYLAAYLWLRRHFGVHAIIHMGKHGNLEWLPGKALALSQTCWPEVTLGPVPHLYPFIVNDPGEGTQAKRRSAAVIIDHLTPPLTRAESHGAMRDLEALVDEYYEALGADPRRLSVLSRQISELMAVSGLDADLGIKGGESEEARLERLDAHLCDLKEMQIRDGLHVFGVAPEGRLLTDLLVALARVPRGAGEGGEASLQRAIAADALGGGFDPLTCNPSDPWQGLKPDSLQAVRDDPWRTQGDTVERIELLAARLVTGETPCPALWHATPAVLDQIATRLKPAVSACGAAEIDGLLRGLDGRFVRPGPSGAPTRGRPDVLPTGRNFYSVDTRSVPTETAWALGRKSAEALLVRHAQDHGEWPRAIGLTAWGTANMRTGGDDIAQALALIGVKPVWDGPSRRVNGFEILPVAALGRPRVDVTLRISGFFRDAFPDQIALFDSAARAVGALDEPEADNPLAARMQREAAALRASGIAAAEATLRAGSRVFGSMPGAYGAGLQALIDEGGWSGRGDFAEAYLAWGAFAYGGGREGETARADFETRLKGIDAIVQNQDNREHDLLDSDDYYQFEGGMAAAAETLSGVRPPIYHNDHSRPERPVIRTLEDEIARVVRGRCANPKWIAGVMRHGYKGAFEIAATVDYLFAFAATTGAVRDHHFQQVFDAYLADEAVRDFIAHSNQDALRDMAARFDEAMRRGLWTPKSNSAQYLIARLQGSES
jgi:cobaltochelatase CobN